MGMFAGAKGPPQLPPPPPAPAPVDREVDQAVTDARRKKAQELAAASGYQSTILTGQGGAGATTGGGKTLLGQ